MASPEKITYDQFIEALIVVAVVMGDVIWRYFRVETEPVQRPTSDSNWLDSKAARRHVCFGETKFRELVKQGILPPGRKIGGKDFWDKRELDRAMASRMRRHRRLAHLIH